MRESKYDRKLNDELSRCLECGKFYDQQADLQLCDKCMDLFDTDKIWELHDGNQHDALDFNERKSFRERFRKNEKGNAIKG